MRSTIRIGLSLLLAMTATLVIPSAPVAAGPGDNYVVDDALSGPRTRWFDEARFGMFIHFGPYAVYRVNTERAAKSSGSNGNATSRGATTRPRPPPSTPRRSTRTRSCSWPSRRARNTSSSPPSTTTVSPCGPPGVNRWNIRDHSGFSRDLLRELKDAATANGIKLGFYYSIWDWHEPDFVANFPAYVTKMKAQLQELVTNYDPALLWFCASSSCTRAAEVCAISTNDSASTRRPSLGRAVVRLQRDRVAGLPALEAERAGPERARGRTRRPRAPPPPRARSRARAPTGGSGTARRARRGGSRSRAGPSTRMPETSFAWPSAPLARAGRSRTASRGTGPPVSAASRRVSVPATSVRLDLAAVVEARRRQAEGVGAAVGATPSRCGRATAAGRGPRRTPRAARTRA